MAARKIARREWTRSDVRELKSMAREFRRGRSPASCGGRKEPCGRRRSCWELRSARGGIAGGSDPDVRFQES